MKRYSSMLSVAATVVLLGTVTANGVYLKSPEAKAAITNDQAKELFSERCSACHDLPDPEAHGFTKAEWQNTVNRMLNQHNAKESITDVEAAEIVEYLSQFPPKPAGSFLSYGIGVWQTDPVVSVAYPFTFPPNLLNFDSHGGSWKVIETPDVYSGYLRGGSGSSMPAVLIENKDSLPGGLDLQVQFQVQKSASDSAVGVVFGATDDRNFFAAQYAPSNNSVTLTKYTNGQASLWQQTALPQDVTVPAVGQHNIRVKVLEHGTAVEISLDYQRIIRSLIPDWKGGKVGLIENGQTVAAFRNLTADAYQSGTPSPAGDIMLH